MNTPEILVILDDVEYARLVRREARRERRALRRKVNRLYAEWSEQVTRFWDKLAEEPRK